MQMTPKKSAAFVAGVAIRPSSRLVKWLDEEVAATSMRRRFRLPVVVRFEDAYRLGFRDAFVGTSEAELDDGALFLALDDSGMSISLLDQLRDRCPPEREWCAVWLDGYWGPLFGTVMPGLGVDDSDESPPFSVLSVHQVIASDAGIAGEVTAFVESLPT